MKQYQFRALIMLELAACEAAARGQLGGMRRCCLLQPCRGTYFPALISAEEELTARAAMHAVIDTPLADGEAGAFFAPGRRFTIWADAVVGHMVHAHGLVGQGIIAYPVSLPLSSAHGGRVEGKAAHPARRHSLAALGAPAAHDHGQQLAVRTIPNWRSSCTMPCPAARPPVSRKTLPMMTKHRPYVATTPQVWAMHAFMPPYLQVSILLGALAGLQAAEACGLRPGDVDLALGIIHPAVQYPAEPLKTETSRTAIPIPSSLSTELLAHQAQFPGPVVLCDLDGHQIGPWRLEWAFCAARDKVTGLPDRFRYNDLRHFFASVLFASGADVKKVQARLRHAGARTGLRAYEQLWPDTDESTRASLEAVFIARPEQGQYQKRAV